MGFLSSVNALSERQITGDQDRAVRMVGCPAVPYYQLFSAGALDFVNVHVEFCPPAAAVTWADSVLSLYADRVAIISTHGYIDGAGNRGVFLYPGTQYLWDDLAVANSNVRFMLSAHVSAEAVRRPRH